ncbi:hypothetical protein P4V43_13345 [Brevibacillus fortis]|uniref:Uncharacterized protein n=1 Tax=Brevibacillus fortis TaxID=2126352 RepID=A0A2P7VEA1_9BACL|nr:hypothetical protein [Brevibacillus fortis]MED1782800.1 hypothetical protein [Brevibacillus fortis]PSJ97566.1 hypothetical protein C7R93_08035 [Brevibacillus fortis]
MPCILKGLTLPVCLTLTYNLSSRLLVDSSIDCVETGKECQLEAELDSFNKNLIIKIPITLEGEVSFADNTQSGCVTTGVHLTGT